MLFANENEQARLLNDLNEECTGMREQQYEKEDETTSYLLKACLAYKKEGDSSGLNVLISLSRESFENLDFNRKFVGGSIYDEVNVFAFACEFAAKGYNALLYRILDLPDEKFEKINITVEMPDWKIRAGHANIFKITTLSTIKIEKLLNAIELRKENGKHLFGRLCYEVSKNINAKYWMKYLSDYEALISNDALTAYDHEPFEEILIRYLSTITTSTASVFLKRKLLCYRVVKEIIVVCNLNDEDSKIYKMLYRCNNKDEFFAIIYMLCQVGKINELNYSLIHQAASLVKNGIDENFYKNLEGILTGRLQNFDKEKAVGFNEQGIDFSGYFSNGKQEGIRLEVKSINYANIINYYVFCMIFGMNPNMVAMQLKEFLGKFVKVLLQDKIYPPADFMGMFLTALTFKYKPKDPMLDRYLIKIGMTNKDYQKIGTYLIVRELIGSDSKDASKINFLKNTMLAEGSIYSWIKDDNAKRLQAGFHCVKNELSSALRILQSIENKIDSDQSTINLIALGLQESVLIKCIINFRKEGKFNGEAFLKYNEIITRHYPSQILYLNEHEVCIKPFLELYNLIFNVILNNNFNQEIECKLGSSLTLSDMYSIIKREMEFDCIVDFLKWIQIIKQGKKGSGEFLLSAVSSRPPEIKLMERYDQLSYRSNWDVKERENYRDLLTQVKKRRNNNNMKNTLSYFYTIPDDVFQKLQDYYDELSRAQSIEEVSPKVVTVPVVEVVKEEKLVILLKQYFSIDIFTYQITQKEINIIAAQGGELCAEQFLEKMLKGSQFKQIKSLFDIQNKKGVVTIKVTRPKKEGALLQHLENNKLKNQYLTSIFSKEEKKDKKADVVINPPARMAFTEDDINTVKTKVGKVCFGSESEVIPSLDKFSVEIRLLLKVNPDNKKLQFTVDKNEICETDPSVLEEYKQRLTKHFNLETISFDNNLLVFRMKSEAIPSLYALDANRSIREPFTALIKGLVEKKPADEIKKIDETVPDLDQKDSAMMPEQAQQIQKSALDMLKAIILELIPSLNRACGWLTYPKNKAGRVNAKRYAFSIPRENISLSIGDKLIKPFDLIAIFVSQCDKNNIAFNQYTGILSIDKNYLDQLFMTRNDLLRDSINDLLAEKAFNRIISDDAKERVLPPKVIESPTFFRTVRKGLIHQPDVNLLLTIETRSSLVWIGDLLDRIEKMQEPHDSDYPVSYYALVFNLLRFLERSKSFGTALIDESINALRNKLMHGSAYFKLDSMIIAGKCLVEIIPGAGVNTIEFCRLRQAITQIEEHLYLKSKLMEFNLDLKLLQIENGLKWFYYSCSKIMDSNDVTFHPDLRDAVSMFITLIGEGCQALHNHLSFHEYNLALRSYEGVIKFIEECKPKRDKFGHEAGVVDGPRFAVVELISFSDIYKWAEENRIWLEKYFGEVVDESLLPSCRATRDIS